jgi:glycosyltransferase involved in cell wall biosynthesis
MLLDRPANNMIDYIRIARQLKKQLTIYDPDTLISFLPLANVVGSFVGWLHDVPVRIACQRNPVQTYSRAMRFFDWYAGTCGLYTHNVTNSGDVQASIRGYPKPYRIRTRTIYNGITAAGRSMDKNLARIALGEDHADVLLVSVGRLARQKNHVFLIQLLGALPGFKLLIAGDGDDSKLRAEATQMGVGQRVRFLGQLSRDRMDELLCAADIFLLPSLYEGQSNALLEAMAAGLPIVTSDIPCHRETLIDGSEKSGFVIPITDPGLWIKTLKDLAFNIRLREQVSLSAQKRVQFFSLTRMRSEFEKVLASTSNS